MHSRATTSRNWILPRILLGSNFSGLRAPPGAEQRQVLRPAASSPRQDLRVGMTHPLQPHSHGVGELPPPWSPFSTSGMGGESAPDGASRQDIRCRPDFSTSDVGTEFRRPFLHPKPTRQDTTHRTPARSRCRSFATRSRGQAPGQGQARPPRCPLRRAPPTLRHPGPAQAEPPLLLRPRVPQPPARPSPDRPGPAPTAQALESRASAAGGQCSGFTLGNSPPLGVAPGRTQPATLKRCAPRRTPEAPPPTSGPRPRPARASIAALGGGRPQRLGGPPRPPGGWRSPSLDRGCPRRSVR